jgi:hypothetical protein
MAPVVIHVNTKENVMASTLGKNLKITAPRSAQTQTRAMFDIVGATRLEPMPALDVFRFGGASVAFEYIADAEALTIAQMRIAPWIEIVVDDVAGATRALAKLGLERLEYHDQDHPYFAAASGLVLRLAAPGQLA